VSGASLLAPFLTYVEQRWREGCSSGVPLYTELCQRGYRGSRRTLRRYLTAYRRATPPPARATIVAPRQVAALVVRRPDKLSAADQALLEQLCARCEHLATMCHLARTFATALRERRGAAAFAPWAAEAEGSKVSELRGFVAGLRQDEAAVIAGLTLPWSSGVVEGHVTRVKLIKRQMYGRGNVDLLRRRVLLAS
jgi:transposase